jgi:hypothetical protein
MPVIKPSRHFEGSKLHSWNPTEGIYRAVFKKFYESPTSQGYEGFKMQWELISDPSFQFEVTNAYSYRKMGLFYMLMERWNRGTGRKVKKDENTNLPDLTEWLDEEADVVVKKLYGKVSIIESAFLPGTLLVREDEYTYRAKGGGFYLNE